MNLTDSDMLELIRPLVGGHCRITIDAVGEAHHVRIDRRNPAGVPNPLPAHLRSTSGEADEFCSFTIGAKEQALSPTDLVDHIKQCVPDSWEA